MADIVPAIIAGIGAGIGFALVGKAFNSIGKSSYPDKMKCLQCCNEILLPVSVFQWHCPCCNSMNPGNKQNKTCFRCGAGKPSHYKYYVICGYCSFKNEVPKNRMANSVNSTKSLLKKKLGKSKEEKQIEGPNNKNNKNSNNITNQTSTNNNNDLNSNNNNNNSTIQTAAVNDNNPPAYNTIFNNNNNNNPPPALLQGRHFTLGDSTI